VITANPEKTAFYRQDAMTPKKPERDGFRVFALLAV
jgi:hypothetical protein